ncbi:hypothetical protein B0T13DRAFT_444935 [Neurospora crassa]|nr:hypothetical protein B0T13DRAFT_444935 [Neurospora crassa]
MSRNPSTHPPFALLPQEEEEESLVRHHLKFIFSVSIGVIWGINNNLYIINAIIYLFAVNLLYTLRYTAAAICYYNKITKSFANFFLIFKENLIKVINTILLLVRRNNWRLIRLKKDYLEKVYKVIEYYSRPVGKGVKFKISYNRYYLIRLRAFYKFFEFIYRRKKALIKIFYYRKGGKKGKKGVKYYKKLRIVVEGEGVRREGRYNNIVVTRYTKRRRSSVISRSLRYNRYNLKRYFYRRSQY